MEKKKTQRKRRAQKVDRKKKNTIIMWKLKNVREKNEPTDSTRTIFTTKRQVNRSIETEIDGQKASQTDGRTRDLTVCPGAPGTPGRPSSPCKCQGKKTVDWLTDSFLHWYIITIPLDQVLHTDSNIYKQNDDGGDDDDDDDDFYTHILMDTSA